ncbi:MAG: hypothetical protein ACMG6E_10160 [Candidatus Roizmanbacteria bacterium]
MQRNTDDSSYKQRTKDERTSLLTGEFIEDKYPEDLNELVQPKESASTGKNKKKKKAKKNKNKSKDINANSEDKVDELALRPSIFDGLELNQSNGKGDVKEETLLKILQNI